MSAIHPIEPIRAGISNGRCRTKRSFTPREDPALRDLKLNLKAHRFFERIGSTTFLLLAERYGAETTVPDWSKRLRCSEGGSSVSHACSRPGTGQHEIDIAAV